jgi:hypothetical protein
LEELDTSKLLKYIKITINIKLYANCRSTLGVHWIVKLCGTFVKEGNGIYLELCVSGFNNISRTRPKWEDDNWSGVGTYKLFDRWKSKVKQYCIVFLGCSPSSTD